MYARGREIIEPGINELEVFSQLQSVAVAHFGEMLTATGNDYQSGNAAGRRATAGPRMASCTSSTWGRLTRATLPTTRRDRGQPSPDRRPTAGLRKIAEVFTMLECSVKPGVRRRAIFDAAQAILDEYRPGSFDHHLGHGIGLYPHECRT